MGPITCEEELEQRALEIGVLPFFRCGVQGLSMEEMTPPSFWFVGGVEGPWEWRMPVATRKRAIYGKFFHGKAGFIAASLMPLFCNLRRDGYDFDTLYEMGMAREDDRRIVTALSQYGPMRTRDVKRACGMTDPGSGFDSAVTRLMMRGYVAVEGFEYALDKRGRPYGWGLARYALLDQMLGEDVTRSRYGEDKEESLEHLISSIHGFDKGPLRKLLKS